MTLDALLRLLKRVGRDGAGYKAICPAHDDHEPSLGVSEGHDGRILLTCRVGCATASVVAALGLEMKDLFPERRPKKEIVATYDYRDEAGQILYQVLRYANKDFKQRHPDGKGDWIWNLKGVRRVMYRLPELLAADPTLPVFVVEGEKDVDRLIALGAIATCNSGGAGKWREEYADHFKGRNVIVVPDNDDAGRQHARQVANSVARVAAMVVLLDALPGVPPKGDVSDYLANHTLADLLKLATDSEPYVPGLANAIAPCTLDHVRKDEFVVYQSGSRNGQIIPDHQGNIRLGLAKLGLGLRYNAFAAKMLVAYQGTEQPLDDAVIDRAWLQIDEVFKFRPSIEFFRTVVNDLARRHSFHPVKEYLEGLTWNRKPRIDTWLCTYGGAPDTTYIRAVGAIFLIAAVGRVRTPGCKFDELITLESPQGWLKSGALKALCPQEDWFSDDLPLGVDAKQIIERTAGKWIIEASELQGFTNSEIERLKAMLSRQVDGPVRLAYARTPVEVPRQFVLAGTTNKLTEYLRDCTGNRRFWPVNVQCFNLDALKRDRDQLWAEAAFREATGASIRLPEELWPVAAVEQEARRQVDPWEELLDDGSEDFGINFKAEAIPVDGLWRALGDAAKFYKMSDAERIAKIVQRHGFTRKKKIDSVCTVIVRKHDGSTEQRIDVKRQWAWIREGKDPGRIEWTRQEQERQEVLF